MGRGVGNGGCDDVSKEIGGVGWGGEESRGKVKKISTDEIFLLPEKGGSGVIRQNQREIVEIWRGEWGGNGKNTHTHIQDRAEMTALPTQRSALCWM